MPPKKITTKQTRPRQLLSISPDLSDLDRFEWFRDADIGHLRQLVLSQAMKENFAEFDICVPGSERTYDLQNLRFNARELRANFSFKWHKLCNWLQRATTYVNKMTSVPCKVKHRRKALATLEHTLSYATHVVLLKRHSNCECSVCGWKTHSCICHPFLPDVDLESELSISLLTRLIDVLNHLRTVVSLKAIALSDFSFHRKLWCFITRINSLQSEGVLQFTNTCNLNYMMYQPYGNVTYTGETSRNMNSRMHEHYRNIYAGRSKKWIPGYQIMAPLGMHSFVCIPLATPSPMATKLERFKLEQMFNRHFQCRGNTPFAQKCLPNKDFVSARYIGGKPKPYRSKRTCRPFDGLESQLKSQSTHHQSYFDLSVNKIERARNELMKQGGHERTATKLLKHMTNLEVHSLYQQLYRCKTDRVQDIALCRLTNFILNANRPVPQQYNYQIRIPFAKSLNLQRTVMTIVSGWLNSAKSLQGKFVTVTCKYVSNTSIQDIVCNYREFAKSITAPIRIRRRVKSDYATHQIPADVHCTCNKIVDFFGIHEDPERIRTEHIAHRMYPETLLPRLGNANVSAATTTEPTPNQVLALVKKSFRRIANKLKIKGSRAASQQLTTALQPMAMQQFLRSKQDIITAAEVSQAFIGIRNSSVVSTIDKSKGELCIMCPVLAYSMYTKQVFASKRHIRLSLIHI